MAKTYPKIEVRLHAKAGAPSVAALLAESGHGEVLSPPASAIVETLERQEQAMRLHQHEHTNSERC